MPSPPEAPCPSVDTLFAHVAGYLSTDETAALEAHLAHCDACCVVLAEAGRSLVSGADSSASALSSSAALPAAATSAPAPRALPKVGDRVGRYLLMDVLGRGAMGIVFAAYDPELDRKVAVKLVRMGERGVGTLDPELEARLLGEAQAMARLAHPNVVPVHDIGSVDGGIYLAMELVTGATLRAWLAAAPRTWRAIVDTFLHAGAGLAAAHAVGIVHRDFKPDNVLVHESGRVFVTDFGLARVTTREVSASALGASDLTTSELRKTRAGTIIGTPAYMAPEQLNSGQLGPDAVDLRADIFAFGASLYEALYRTRPYPGATLGELEQALRRGTPQPPPPSAVPGWVRRVVLRALAGDPAARFQSMPALLAALRADPRKKLLRIAVPLAALALVAGTIVTVERLTTAEARGCRDSASVAESVWGPEQQAAAEAAFRATGKAFAPEAFVSARLTLEQHLAGWSAARIEACDATHAQGTQSEALLDLRLGCLDQRLGETQALVSAFIAADASTVENAPEAAARLPDASICGETERLTARVPPPTDAAAMLLVEEAERQLAQAEAAALVGAWAGASDLAKAAVAGAKQAAYAPAEAEALTLLAQVTFSVGDFPESRRLYEQAIPLAVGAGDDRLAAKATMAYARVLGVTTRDKAEPLRWMALAEAQIRRLGGDPGLTSELLLQRADVFLLAFDDESALVDLEAAVKLQAERGAADPVVARSLSALARAYQQAERYGEAIATFERALTLMRATLGPIHPQTIALAVNFGGCLGSSGHYAAAERVLATAQVEAARIYPTDHQDLATGAHMRGIALTGLGRYDEALALHDQGIAIETRLFGDNLGQVALSNCFRALTEIRAGRGVGALAAVARADELATRHLAGNTAIAGVVTLLRALALESAARYDEAGAAFSAFEPTARTVFGSGTEMAMTLDGLGRDLVRKGHASEAVARHEEALAMFESHYGATSLELAPTLVDLGRALVAAGRGSDARAPLERVLALLSAEPSDPLLGAEARVALARALAVSDPSRSSSLIAEALAAGRSSPYPRAARLVSEIEAGP